MRCCLRKHDFIQVPEQGKHRQAYAAIASNLSTRMRPEQYIACIEDIEECPASSNSPSLRLSESQTSSGLDHSPQLVSSQKTLVQAQEGRHGRIPKPPLQRIPSTRPRGSPHKTQANLVPAMALRRSSLISSEKRRTLGASLGWRTRLDWAEVSLGKLLGTLLLVTSVSLTKQMRGIGGGPNFPKKGPSDTSSQVDTSMDRQTSRNHSL